MEGLATFFLLRIPAVVSTQNMLDVVFRGLFARELVRPGYTSFGIGTFAFVLVLAVSGSLFVGGFAPVVPPFGTDVAAHFTAGKEYGGIGTPRTAEVYAVYTLVGGQSAVVEYIAVGNVFGGGGCRDVGVLLAVYGAVFEPCGCFAEDEVGCAFDVAVFIILASAFTVGI